MGYVDFSLKEISRSLCRSGGAETGPSVWKCRIVHKLSLTQFLLFCKKLGWSRSASVNSKRVALLHEPAAVIKLLASRGTKRRMGHRRRG
jgi:hypothetical protein